MEYVRLGQSGLKVSRLCLGTMNMGTPQWKPWIFDEAQSEPIVRHALEAGVNFIDLADFYSAGVGEEVVGRILKRLARREGGLRFGGAYAFSEDASFSNNRTFSLGASYAVGSLNFGLGYLQADRAGNTQKGALARDDANFTADLTRIIGAGVNYTAGPAVLGFAYSTSYFSKPTNNVYLGALTNSAGGPIDSLRYHNFEVNGKYQLTPAIFVGGQYVLSLVKYDAATGNAKPLVHTVGLMANYAFSKRTDIYAQTSYQTVKGGKTGTALDNGYIPSAQGASSTNSQVTARVALRHRF